MEKSKLMKPFVGAPFQEKYGEDLSDLEYAMDMGVSLKKLMTTPLSETPYSCLNFISESYFKDLPQWFSVYQALSYVLEDALTYKVTLQTSKNEFLGYMIFTQNKPFKSHSISLPRVVNLGVFIPLPCELSSIREALSIPFRELLMKYDDIVWNVPLASSADEVFKKLIGECVRAPYSSSRTLVPLEERTCVKFHICNTYGPFYSPF